MILRILNFFSIFKEIIVDLNLNLNLNLEINRFPNSNKNNLYFGDVNKINKN